MAEIHCPLHEAARISRDEPALRWPGDELNYYELDQYAGGTAQQLARAGFRAGDRIGLIATGIWPSVVAFAGILRLGAVACPLNARLPPATIAALLEQVQAAGLLAEEDVPAAPGRRLSVKAVVKHPDPRLPGASVLRPRLDQEATIIFTSGSAGRPKAVLHTLGNHYYSALGSNHNIRVRSKQSWLLSVPFSHVSGIGVLYRCWLGGAAVCLPEPGCPLPDAVAACRPDHISVVPTQLRRWLRDLRPVESLRTVLVGGAPAPREWIDQALAAKLPVVCTYGLTEMASQVTTEAVVMPASRRGTSGQVLRHRELKISAGGEILVRGQTLFKGYVDGAGLARPLDADGWFATGDLGSMGEDGSLSVLGRRDHLIISGGENIHPEEVEAALCALQGVESAVVVPVPDEEYGRRPVAFVRYVGEAQAAESVRAALRERLPGFMVPDAVLAWPEDEEAGAKANRARFAEIAERVLSRGP